MIFIYFISILAVFVVIYLIFTYVTKRNFKSSVVKQIEHVSSLPKSDEKLLTIGQILKSCDSGEELYIKATNLLERFLYIISHKSIQLETSNENIIEFQNFINQNEYIPLQELVRTLIEEISATDTFIVKDQDLRIHNGHLYYCCWIEYNLVTHFYLETEVNQNSGKIFKAFTTWKHNRQAAKNYKLIINPPDYESTQEIEKAEKTLINNQIEAATIK